MLMKKSLYSQKDHNRTQSSGLSALTAIILDKGGFNNFLLKDNSYIGMQLLETYKVKLADASSFTHCVNWKTFSYSLKDCTKSSF